ncbi:hypothetical protein HBH99_256850, partial [Parastagonospora nodorum]
PFRFGIFLARKQSRCAAVYRNHSSPSHDTSDLSHPIALGANNPVDEVEGEAANIRSPGVGALKPLVKCFVSIGTGYPGKKALEDNMVKFLSKSL